MRTILIAFISLLIVACSGGDNQDLREWMNEAGKNIKGKIPPLPEVKPYEAVPYDAGNLVDPFRPAKIAAEQQKKGAGGLQPDMDRPREPLEAYSLESLKFVGVITKKAMSYAIIQVDGALYQARVGNYMGQSFGVITKVTESEVILKELTQDSSGDWVEKMSVLLLQGQEGKK